jgi:hypothetical protein
MMRIRKSLAIAAVAALPWWAGAFSLLGPYEAWQTQALGFQLPAPASDLGGPQRIESGGYRWQFPTITYGFTYEFQRYFGTNGMAAVDRAMEIFNSLPRFSLMSPDLREYPEMGMVKVNSRARADGIFDVKSLAMAVVLEQLGLADPVRFTWVIHHVNPDAAQVGYTNYFVRNMNYDPVTLIQTNRVNGVNYAYRTFWRPQLQGWPYAPFADAFEYANNERPDPSLFLNLPTDLYAVTPYNQDRLPIASQFLPAGYYSRGLTRDDVGGLRYLYTRDNYAFETLPAGVTAATNVVGGGGGYGIYFGTNFTGNTNYTFITATNVLITDGLRAGVDQIRFVRVNYDSIMGLVWPAYTNVYTDIVVSNRTVVNQQVQRVVDTTPDIVFDAQELGFSPSGIPIPHTRTVGFGAQAPSNRVITPPVRLTYTTLYPIFVNDNYLGGQNRLNVWGSFDGSTNAPVIYGFGGASIREYERSVVIGQ